ncbi:putative transcriptional regulator YdeE [Rhodococcus sp. LBL1]|nr:putative transcriptional regulator YdeE [Rhodococcus sp. LBL1]MDH6683179.1 putative transcriptional regulator YdeE [Rhodococcus sp. LBL2]
MQVVERTAATIVGIEVVAPYAELAVVVPQAWARVFARRRDLLTGPDDVFVEFSTDLGGGDYREVLGVVVDSLPASLPEGWSIAKAPGGRYLHHRHLGDESTIADTFGAMHRWAEVNELQAGVHKLDVGYRPDRAVAHDLYLGLG